MSLRRPGLAAPLVALAALGGAPDATAAPERVALEVQRDADVATCPDDETLRRDVAAQLGSDPFDDHAATRLVIALSRKGNVFRAEISRRDETGTAAGTQALDSPDCGELVSAAAAALAVLLQPQMPRRPVRRALPPPTATRTPPEKDRAPPQPVGLREHVDVRVAIGVLGAMATAPAPAFGLTAHVGLRVRRAYVAVEGRADLVAGRELPNGERIGSQLFLGTLAPCGVLGAFLICGLASAGAMRASAYAQATTAYGALGARLAPMLRLGRFDAMLNADLVAPLVHPTLRVAGAAVWSAPPVAGALGLSIGGHFP
jgi:hypothetical protein